MNNPFFSIIIPVYNGLYTGLPKCLDSIWNQPIDIDIYEVIVVDDCSTDGTRQWLHDQEKLHPSLRVVENEVNVRQGGSRNHGVIAAKGKYFLFIDQDDYYHPGSLAKVYEHLLEHPELEVVVTDSAWQFIGHESNKLQLNYPFEGVCTGIEFLQKNWLCIAPWRFCINREFYQSHQLCFPEHERTEDIEWVFKLFYYTERIQYLRLLLIHYNKGNDSQTENVYRDFDTIKGTKLAADRLFDLAETLYKQTPVYNLVKETAESYCYAAIKNYYGAYWSIKAQKELLQSMPMKQSKYRLLNFALHHPTLFSILSNMGVIPYRIARYFRRKMQARKYAD